MRGFNVNNNATAAKTLRLAAILWTGVMAGFFYALSAVVIPGLGAADPVVAMESMHVINATARNLVFTVGFFGAPLLCAVAMFHAVFARDWPAASMVLFGGAVYLIGAFAVTFVFNQPLTEALGRLDPGVAASHTNTLRHISEWSIWNNVRIVSSAVAFASLVCSQVIKPARSGAVLEMARPAPGAA